MGEPIEIFGTRHSAAKRCLAGTHRTRDPRETFADYSRLMPRLGITRVANLTGLDYIGLPVFTAIRPNARSLSTSQGKGVDPEAARVSALMESIEFWHAEQNNHPLRLASYLDLRRSQRVVDIDLLCRSRRGGRLRHDMARTWIQGFDLIAGEPTWVPFEIMSLGSYSPSNVPDFSATTNGLASGNHLLEAAVHGLCELIERDAETLWHHSADLNVVDRTTVVDPECEKIMGMLSAIGASVLISDLTSDIGIPTYRCLLIDPPERVKLRAVAVGDGYGSHLSPAIALSRALTEAIQVRLTYIAGSRDDLRRESFNPTTDTRTQLAMLEHMREAEPECTFHRADQATGSFEDDLRVLLGAVRRVGIESVILVDLTQADVGIPVVFMVAPGLEGYPSTHLPGRRVQSLLAGGR